MAYWLREHAQISIVYTYIYISIYLYIYISIYLYIYISIYLYIYISIYLYIYISMCISIYLYIDISIQLCVYIYVYIYMYTYVYIYMYIYICMFSEPSAAICGSRAPQSPMSPPWTCLGAQNVLCFLAGIAAVKAGLQHYQLSNADCNPFAFVRTCHPRDLVCS